MMLYRLLKDVRPDDYCLISTSNFETGEEVYSRTLPGKYFQISAAFELTRGYRFGLKILREVFNVSLGAFARARQIAHIVRTEHCQAVLSCSSGADLLDVPAGFIASRLARVPFYVYLFDTYSHMWVQADTQFIGRRLEPFILRRAAGIVSTNELVRKLLASRYGVDSTVIHNPCDISEYEKLSHESVPRSDDEVRIVYTGSISESHYDALRNLVTAIELIGRRNVKLHLYTFTSTDRLAAEGIRGPVVYHGHESVFTMPSVQREADILFLPLAFESPYPELMRVSSPSKIGEFLAARKPVLVHAPPDSFLSTYFRRYECGLVADQNKPEAVAEALEKLMDDSELRQRLSANAWIRATTDFSLPVAQSTLATLLDLNLQSDPVAQAV